MMMMMKLKSKCMMMESLKLLGSKIILKDQDLWNYREKKIKAKFLQNSCLRGKIQGEWTVEQGR